MKFQPPLNSQNPNASYQNGDPIQGILGSKVPAEAIEGPQREIVNVILAAGITPNEADNSQLTQAIQFIAGNVGSSGINIPAQALMQANLGLRPDGWTEEDCDPPTCAIVSDKLLPQTTPWGVNGIITASSESAGYQAWKMWNGIQNTTASNSWLSNGVSTTETLNMKLHANRAFDALHLGSYTGGISNSPVSGEIYVDDILNTTFSGLVWSSATEIKTIPLTTPITSGRKVDVKLDPISGRLGVGTLGLQFTDCPAGSILVLPGLQLAYADFGAVTISNVLLENKYGSVTDLPDGSYFIYAALDSFKNVDTIHVSPNRPLIGTFRKTEYVSITPGTPIGDMDLMANAFDGSLGGINTVCARKTGTSILGNTFEGATRTDAVLMYPSIDSGFISGSGNVKFEIYGGEVYDLEQMTLIGSKTVANTKTSVAIPVTGNHPVMVAKIIPPSQAQACFVAEMVWQRVMDGGDLFDPFRLTVRNFEDVLIRRVPIGMLTISGGSIVNMSSYALGNRTMIPVNNGDLVALNSIYEQSLPYPCWDTQLAIPYIYTENMWGWPGWEFLYSGGNKSLGVTSLMAKETLRTITGTSNFAANRIFSGSEFGITTAVTTVKCRVCATRGY